jgi:hypothetical protein
VTEQTKIELTAEEKTRHYETQVKQFAFQAATQLAAADGTQNSKMPPVEDLLQSADLIFRWFKHGTVPSSPMLPVGAKLN